MAKKTLKTNQGAMVTNNGNSLPTGQRGPVILQEVHLIKEQETA
jgi:catalase